ncbi:uncharacterized protein METZ01_LOCUS72506 [marine metagenome]|uniref:Uncharacterized protein n=1 Tax=marine metagenome TaxID=408172 RepID=A0A381TUD1_9ZZZZ
MKDKTFGAINKFKGAFKYVALDPEKTPKEKEETK